MLIIRPIPNTQYFVSACGGVYSIGGKYTERSHHSKIQKLNTYVSGRGYECVVLRNVKGKKETYQVHRLIADLFLQREEQQTIVRHLDGNRLHNVLSNVAWGTYKDNAADALAHGTFVIGEKNGQAKLNADKVRLIRDLYRQGMTQHQLGKQFGVNNGTISYVVNRKNWKWVV